MKARLALSFLASLVLFTPSAAFADDDNDGYPAGIDFVVCRTYDLASRQATYTPPRAYSSGEDAANEMKWLAGKFHSATAGEFKLSGSARSFCDLFPNKASAQAFVAKDSKGAASEGMKVRQASFEKVNALGFEEAGTDAAIFRFLGL